MHEERRAENTARLCDSHAGLSIEVRSDLERAPTATAFDDIGVVEYEAALLETIVEINDGAVEIGVEFLIDGELDTMNVEDAIALGGLGVEVQAIGETATTAALNTNPQHHAFGHVLFGDDFLDFDSSLLAEGYTHRDDLLKWSGPGRNNPRLLTHTIIADGQIPASAIQAALSGLSLWTASATW